MKHFHRVVVTRKVIRILKALSSAMSPEVKPITVTYRRRHA